MSGINSSPICLHGQPGAMPSGSMPSDQGAREQKANSEVANATPEQGNVLQFLGRLAGSLRSYIHMCVLVSFKC